MTHHPAENDAALVTSVNGEEMLAVPAQVDGTPGWMSVESDPPRRFWGARYVANTSHIPPGGDQ